MKYLVILMAVTFPLLGRASEMSSYLAARDTSMSLADKQESGIRFLQIAKSQGLAPVNEAKCLESFAGSETGPKGPSANLGGSTGGGGGESKLGGSTSGGGGDSIFGGNDPCGLVQIGFNLALKINERAGGAGTGGGGGTN